MWVAFQPIKNGANLNWYISKCDENEKSQDHHPSLSIRCFPAFEWQCFLGEYKQVRTEE
jgi:hypothetical protein